MKQSFTSLHCPHARTQAQWQIKTYLRWWVLGFISALGFFFPFKNASAGITLNFVLSGSCTTSAGVYDSNNHLVKTLWRKVAYTSGSQQVTWDGTQDDGTTAPDGNYRIKLLSNNISYVWDGVIGNTDTFFTSVATGGDTVWHGYDTITDMAISGTNMFIANGYSEGNANAYRASTSTPNTPKQMVFYGNVLDAALLFEYTATDGTWTYFANAEDGFNNSSCIMAYKVADNTAATFTSGTSYKPKDWQGMPTYNVIDLTLSGTANLSINPPTGLAVQLTGSCLAVPHSGANEIRLFNKRSGQLLGSIALTAPGKVAFNPQNDDLWVITGTTLQRFTAAQLATVSATGTQLTPAATITGLASPLAVAVDPRSGTDLVLVADGGMSQQIKGFQSDGSAASGAWSTPLGLAGGYCAANGNFVTTDKFWFPNTQAYIAIQNDGSFWFSDAGNLRNLHFSAARSYLEQIAYLPANYVMTVDPNNPTRVIGGGWLEFQVDYTKTLSPGDPGATGGNNSWKLLRNWGTGVLSNFSNSGTRGGMNTLVTLSNGRTYALVLSTTSSLMSVVELPSTGLLRDTGITVSSGASLYPNGDLRWRTVSSKVQTVTRQQLTGFDTSNNPQWGTAATICSSSANVTDPYYHGSFCGAAGPQFPITDSNVIVSFDPSVTVGSGTNINTGMHLGGVYMSDTSWLWKASPAATTVDFYTQQDGTYDIGDGTNYGGNTVQSNGRNIVYGYHGEGWKGKQANQFVHFYDDGLFVGQFGVPNANTSALTGVAGNSFCSTLVKVSGTTYFYHGDESNHGGVHRWKFSGEDSIGEMAATGTLSGTNTSTVSLTTLLAPPTGLTVDTSNGKVVLSWNVVSGATSYNIYRGTSPSGESATPVYTGTNASQIDLGLTNGTKYYYKIASVNNGGAGGFSSEISATPSSPGSIYEAENYGAMYLMYVRSSTQASNGTYMMGLGGNSGAWLTMNNIDGGTGGTKTLTIRYNASAHAATKYLYVNDVRVATLSFPATSTTGGWGVVSTNITLNSGTSNTISMKDNGDPYWVSFDYFSVK